MKILLAPVGEQTKPIYEGFKHIKDVNRVYLLASDKTLKYAEEISAGLSEVYEIEIITVKADNLDDVMEKITEKLSKHDCYKNIISNITGGTKIMSLACYIVSSFYSGDAFYIFKDGNDLKHVDAPILKVNLKDVLKYTGTRFRILNYIQSSKKNLTEIARNINIKNSTLNRHITILLEHNLVKNQRSGREVLIEITKTGKLFYNLVLLNEKRRKIL